MTLQLTKKHNFDIVFDSQKLFRLILEAFSNPTRIVNIEQFSEKLYGDYPIFTALAMTLLDSEVSFHVCGNSELSDEIKSLTLAKQENIESADFIFICDTDDLTKVIENAKCGTLADPHKSATLIILNDGACEHSLTFLGAGIDGKAEIQTSTIVKETLVLRECQYYEYPQGIDLIFISSNGDLFAIPRLVRQVK